LRSRRAAGIFCLLLVFLAVSVSAIVLAQGKYCGSKKSDVYHYPSCRYVAQILPENLIWFKDEYEAVAKGYRPCKVCNPPYPGQVVTTSTTTRTWTHTSVVTSVSTTTPPTYTSIVTTRTSTSSYSPTERSTTTVSTGTLTQPSPTTQYTGPQTLTTATSTLSPSTPMTIESKAASPTSSATSHMAQVPALDYTTLGVGVILGVVASLVGLGVSRRRVQAGHQYGKGHGARRM